jgi:DNA-directed RNA polymerase specialized sigma24 family protein
MLDLAFRRKLSVREIAQLLHKDAGTISRSIQRLCSRLRDPMVAALLDQKSPLSPEYRQLGMEHFAQGKPIKELSDLHQMSMQEIRQMLHFIREWHRSMYRRTTT